MEKEKGKPKKRGRKPKEKPDVPIIKKKEEGNQKVILQ